MQQCCSDSTVDVESSISPRPKGSLNFIEESDFLEKADTGDILLFRTNKFAA